MRHGWLVDIVANYDRNTVTLWIKDTQGKVEYRSENYHPSFYVYASMAELQELPRRYEGCLGIASYTYEEKRLWLGAPKKKVLKITLTDYQLLRELPEDIARYGCYSRYELFNVGMNIPWMYIVEKNLNPLVLGQLDTGFCPVEKREALDYDTPELISVQIAAENSRRMTPKCDEKLCSIRIDNQVIEGSEEEILKGIIKKMHCSNPDIIYSNGGDEFLFPYLYRRAQENGMTEFSLGRTQESLPMRKERTYFSYGRIRYSPPHCMLNGRMHIDQASSFLYRAGGLNGLIELSRLTRIPLQRLSRVTPGTAITAIQLSQALNENVVIKWKKNIPEQIKDAGTLFRADRGGMIYDPEVGIHEGVVEIDFTSLYPGIMVVHNVSPETLLCDCCPGSRNRVPFIGYHICEKNRGLIPRVVKPLIDRRIEYKRRLDTEKNGERQIIYRQRRDVLKWVLVTCFGYTGYRNACFGRIECHEAITAYGRKILVKAAGIAQERKYRVLHGIVDSLWLQGDGDHDLLCRQIQESIGIPIEIEGVYHWIVFLPNRTNAAGALNRYYGLLTTGEMKVRGLELRQGDMPPIVKEAQRDMLAVVSTARNIREFTRALPRAFAVMARYIDRIQNGECTGDELVFTSRVSKPPDAYAHLTNNVACLLQLQQKGIRVKPGQSVQYVITDAAAKKYYKKVGAWEPAQGQIRYDKKKYMSYIFRAGESLFLPFGYTQEKLGALTRSVTQMRLPC